MRGSLLPSLSESVPGHCHSAQAATTDVRGHCRVWKPWPRVVVSMELLLWAIAVVLVVSGVVVLIRGQMLYGILLIVAGFLVGPGGVSILT